jgi:hypothetical protein
MRTLPTEQIQKLYEDIHLLAAKVKDPEGERWLKLHPGMVLFIDNWRVLHGRASCTGLRKMTVMSVELIMSVKLKFLELYGVLLLDKWNNKRTASTGNGTAVGILAAGCFSEYYNCKPPFTV